MNKMMLFFLFIIAVLVVVCYKKKDELFSEEDNETATCYAKELYSMLDSSEYSPDEVSSDVINGSDVLMTYGTTVEGFSESNSSFWPYYYYSNPAHYAQGGTWPPGMHSRLYNWSPGFDTTTNWQWALRPGISNTRWPRSRWVRHNGKYYYINNRPTFQR